jgi:pimeloyl-ACP methyl ester carboxylesterase
MLFKVLRLTIPLLAVVSMAAAADPQTPPTPQKVVIVVLENHNYEQIVGDTANAPFLNSVISQGLLFNNAHALDHPSQPNYLLLFSGSDQGVNNRNATATNALDLNLLSIVLKAALASPNTPASQKGILQGQLAQVQLALAAGSDPKSLTGDAFPASANFRQPSGAPVSLPFTTPNLGSALLQAGRTFTEYVEGLNDAGASDSYGYAVVAKINNPADPYSVGYAHRHDAASDWISDTPTGNQLPRTAVQDFANFGSDNADFAYLPNVSLVIPNTINDMHDGTYPLPTPISTKAGDAWCKKTLSNYLAWAKTHNSLLIITTDESEADKTNHILTVIAGDPRIVQAGVSDQYVTHVDLLRSIESMFATPYAGASQSALGLAFVNGTIAAPIATLPPQTVTQTISGTSGDSMYRIIVPKPWNGQLVLYAHGAVDVTAPIAIPNTAAELQIFQAVTSQGFALAITSYSQNGWAVKEGVQEVRDLQDLFTARVGKPARTYLVGVSMGGLITLDLAENFPTRYDGAMTICGVVGGTQPQLQRFGDNRVLFDYFFPGVLPGDLLHTPYLDYSVGGPVWNGVVNAIMAGYAAPGNPTLQYASVIGLTGSTPNELIFSAFSLLGSFYTELLQRTGGQSFYDNTKTVYTGSADDARLNARVQRFQAVPAGVDYAAKYYTPTGKLSIPLVTLHTTEDPTVAFSQEAAYAATVAKAGASAFLVQQSADRYGHCNVNPTEILNSFQGLLGWVNFGVKPAGGNVTIP